MTRRRFLADLALATGTVLLPCAAGPAWAEKPVEHPAISLKPGEFHFRLDGKPAFLLGRNPTGWQVEQFEPLFKWASESGEKLARIHLTAGMAPPAPAGEVDESWALKWERVFDMAAQNALYVLPVLCVWADWNDGSKGEPWHRWDKNPFNVALERHPARQPVELLRDSPCRQLWLQWLQKLVARWQGRPEILGWEIFSELDLVTGASEGDATAFAECAAQVIRSTDNLRRPVTASLSGINHWPKLFKSNAVDFIQVHPYADAPKFHGNLDEMILESVRERLAQYRKPVFIGECGLSSGLTPDSLTMKANAAVGVRNAIWASTVSGAMNGRMLWWEDGYDQYSRVDLRTRYKDASAPVARFVKDVDFTGFRPLDVAEAPGLKGGAVGNERAILGWFRDMKCSAPDWPVRHIENGTIKLVAPGAAPSWNAEFSETGSGKASARAACRRRDCEVVIPLPSFEGSIAFKMFAG